MLWDHDTCQLVFTANQHHSPIFDIDNGRFVAVVRDIGACYHETDVRLLLEDNWRWFGVSCF